MGWAVASDRDLATRLYTLKKSYDAQFKVVFDAIRQLMTPPEPKPAYARRRDRE